MSQSGKNNDKTSSGNDIRTITGDTGGAVAGDAAYNVDLLALYTNTVVGDPGTNTLTITPTDRGYPITPYVVGTATYGGYTTVQDAIDAANAAGGGTVYVQPGIYTEDLTLYDAVDLWGAVGVADTEVCKIIGQHTPPDSGALTIRNIFLESATNILNSASSGSATLILIDVAVDVTNGYTFNLPNWTGVLVGFDIGEIQSTNDGWVNNSGGATVFMTNITMGNGTGNTMVTSGSVELYNCVVQCPVDFQTGSTGLIAGGSYFQEAVTFSNNSAFTVTNSSFVPSSGSAITYSSSGDTTIAECVIDTATNPAIAGAGAGTLTLCGLDFVQDSTVAGTLTVTYSPSTVPFGGTGISTTTAYAPVCGGTTATGSFQTADTNFNVAGRVLTSTGAGSLPTWQAVSDADAVKTITGNSGGAESPSSGNFNILGTGSITVAGSANTETVQLTGLTQYNVLVGAGSATITKVAPSATSGVPLISQGAAADPVFGTVEVAGGGTGATSLTDHGVLVGSGTSAVTALSVGSTGTVLAGSSGADPSFTATPSVTSITLSSGTALSSYIQGSFTPGISFGGGTTGITYGNQSGTYTRIGNVVHFHLTVSLTSKGSSTGAAKLTGLPIAASGSGMVGLFQADLIDLSTNYTYFFANYDNGATTATLYQGGDNTSLSGLTDASFSATSTIRLTGIYFV